MVVLSSIQIPRPPEARRVVRPPPVWAPPPADGRVRSGPLSAPSESSPMRSAPARVPRPAPVPAITLQGSPVAAIPIKKRGPGRPRKAAAPVEVGDCGPGKRQVKVCRPTSYGKKK